MLFRLLLLFTIVPLIELWLLLELSEKTSLSVTILIVLATGVIGAWLARLEGWRVMTRMQADVAAGRMPGDAILDGLMILIAGALLITPGLLTDAFGFALLVPPVRGLLKAFLKRRFASRFTVTQMSGECGLRAAGEGGGRQPDHRCGSFRNARNAGRAGIAAAVATIADRRIGSGSRSLEFPNFTAFDGAQSATERTPCKVCQALSGIVIRSCHR